MQDHDQDQDHTIQDKIVLIFKTKELIYKSYNGFQTSNTYA